MKNLQYILFLILLCFSVTDSQAQAWIVQPGTGSSDGLHLSIGTQDWYTFMDANDDLIIRDDGINVLQFDNSTDKEVEQLTGVFITRSIEPTTITDSPDPSKIYGNSLPLAYGYISITGSILQDYGIDSVTNLSTGVYEIVLDNDWSGDPAVFVTSSNISSDTEIAVFDTTGSNTIRVRIVNESNTAINSAFSFVLFGTPL